MITFKFTHNGEKFCCSPYKHGEYSFPSYENLSGPASGVMITANSFKEAAEFWKERHDTYIKGYRNYMKQNPNDLT